MYLLKPEILERVRNNAGVRGRICGATGKAYTTVQRWLEENNMALTTLSALKVMSAAFHLPIDDLVREVDADDIKTLMKAMPTPRRKMKQAHNLKQKSLLK